METLSQKKVFVKNFGCQMNEYDSERMVESLANSGYIKTTSAENADLIILNTCHIREKATEKLYSEIGRFRQSKVDNADLQIAVTGCVAQAEGEEIIHRQPLVDYVIGPQAYHQLEEMIAKKKDKPLVDLEFKQDEKFLRLSQQRTNQKVSAYLTIQEGCDKFCTFCVVPYTRGKEFSRPVKEVVKEALNLVRNGTRELILLGQNVNAYHGLGQKNKPYSLAELIWELAEIKELKRIRFVTSHPNDMSEDLNVAFRDCPKLMPYLHLPIQSGSDKILKWMNRKHTVQKYLEIIDEVRSYQPDIAISGDFIVGFPGEEEEDFLETMEIIRKVQFVKSFSFRYSPRPGTPAAERKQVDPEVQKERLGRLQKLLFEQQKNSLENSVGKRSHVLFEKHGRYTGQLVGKNEHFQIVHAMAPAEWIGTEVEVLYTSASSNALEGESIL